MANPPLAELFFRSFDVRPSADEHGDSGCDACLTSRRLVAAPYASPSLGTIVTTTEARRPPPPPPSSSRGIRGISSSSRSSPMARRGPDSPSGRHVIINTIFYRIYIIGVVLKRERQVMQVSRQPVRVARELTVHFRTVQRSRRHSRDPTPAPRTQQCVRRVASASLPLDGGGGGARRMRSPDSRTV